MDTQKTSYKKGKLSQDRINRLSGIGFTWILVEKGPNVPWETCFDQLVRYKAKHGDCNVPSGQGKLGTWVSKQRAAYKADSLAQDRIERLDSIGFKWAFVEQSAKVPWETQFNELVEYKANHGDCNVPARQGQLGRWVHNQRSNYKEGKLPQDCIDRLNDIGFDWTPPQ